MQDTLLTTLIDRFDRSSMTELDYSDGTARLTLRKGGAARAEARDAPPVREAARTREAAPPPVHAAGGAAQTITAPIVATFYAAPGPDSPPFVREGDAVKKGQTLCILEAMKMMNKLEAEFDCTITAVLAKTGDLVEFGQTLFEVERG